MSLELFCVGRRNDFAKFEEKTVYALTARENILYKHKIKRNKTTTLDRFLDSGRSSRFSVFTYGIIIFCNII